MGALFTTHLKMLLYDTSPLNELHKDSRSRTSINVTTIVEQTAPSGRTLLSAAAETWLSLSQSRRFALFKPTKP